jgi:hypothetical protein
MNPHRSRSIRGSIARGVVALLFLPPTALEAQPANDVFANAGRITGRYGSLAQSTLGATRESGEPAHAGHAGGASVWFAWESPADGAAEFDLHGSGFDTVLGAYTGTSLPTLTAVAENDDAFDYTPRISRWLLRGLSSHVRFPARAGVRYYLAVDGVDGITGDLQLTWNLKPPPANDQFDSAKGIAGANGFLVTHNAGASRQAGEPLHAGLSGAASIWFLWTAPAGGPTRFHTLNSLTPSAGPLDTLLAVYTGDQLDALTLVAANDNNGTSLRSLVQFTATAGRTYHIAVDTKPASAHHGHIVLTWANGAPANDRFAHAQVLNGPCGSIQSHNAAATKEPDEPAITGNAGGASIWYLWTAPADGRAMFSTQGSPFLDTLLAVYTGSSLSALTLVVENDDTTEGFVSGLSYGRVEFEAVAGATYRIAVDGYRGSTTTASGMAVLTWAFEPAANDHLIDAQPLADAGGTVTACTTFSSKQVREPGHGDNDGGGSLWYRWQAPASGVAEIDLAGSLFDTLLAVYRADGVPAVDQLALVAQNDDTFDGFNLAFHSRVNFAVASGESFYIAVDGANDGVGHISDGWMVMRYELHPPARLQIARTNDALVIRWEGPYALESTPALDALAPTRWTPYPGPSPVVMPIGAPGNRFFRAVSPSNP